MRRIISVGKISCVVLPFILPACIVNAADWGTLSDNSPFGQAAPVEVMAVDGLEFRGVVQENGTWVVSLFSTATKTSQWIPVNAGTATLIVNSYDPSADKVEVVHAGRTLTLALKRARVSRDREALPPAIAVNKAADGEGESTMPSAADEIMQEVRRRRAERESRLADSRRQ